MRKFDIDKAAEELGCALKLCDVEKIRKLVNSSVHLKFIFDLRNDDSAEVSTVMELAGQDPTKFKNLLVYASAEDLQKKFIDLYNAYPTCRDKLINTVIAHDNFDELRTNNDTFNWMVANGIHKVLDCVRKEVTATGIKFPMDGRYIFELGHKQITGNEMKNMIKNNADHEFPAFVSGIGNIPLTPEAEIELTKEMKKNFTYGGKGSSRHWYNEPIKEFIKHAGLGVNRALPFILEYLDKEHQDSGDATGVDILKNMIDYIHGIPHAGTQISTGLNKWIPPKHFSQYRSKSIDVQIVGYFLTQAFKNDKALFYNTLKVYLQRSGSTRLFEGDWNGNRSKFDIDCQEMVKYMTSFSIKSISMLQKCNLDNANALSPYLMNKVMHNRVEIVNDKTLRLRR